jgi:hypothetical protein
MASIKTIATTKSTIFRLVLSVLGKITTIVFAPFEFTPGKLDMRSVGLIVAPEMLFNFNVIWLDVKEPTKLLSIKYVTKYAPSTLPAKEN